MAKFRPINRGKKIIIALVTVFVLFGGSYSVSAILGGDLPVTVEAEAPLPTSDAPVPGATGRSVASDPAFTASPPASSSITTGSSSTAPGTSTTAGGATPATASGATDEKNFLKKCREQFESAEGIGGPVLGAILCFVADKLGFALAKTLEYAFDIKNIVASRNNPEINQFIKGQSGWAYTVWRGLTQLANILGVLVLIIVAFANILRLNLNTYAVKRMLPLLIGALIAANSSWLIIGLVYGMSNQVIPDSMYSAIISGIDGLLQSLAAIIAPLFLFVFIAPLLAIVIGIIFLGLFIVMTAAGMILTFQPIIVSAVTMFAPVMIMCAVLPQTQKAFSKWLQILVNWIIMWPLTMLILYAISVIVGLANVGKIIASIVEVMFVFADPDVVVKQSIAEIAALAAPIFVCVALFALAIRLPFMLGKDAVALANSVKDGGKALMGLGIGGFAAGGAALQKGKESAGRLVNRFDVGRTRKAEKHVRGEVEQAVGAGGDRQAELSRIIEEGRQSRSGAGRARARVAATMMKEDQQMEHTTRQEEARRSYLSRVDNINDPNRAYATPADRRRELARAKRDYEEERARIGREFDLDAGLEPLKERARLVVADRERTTVDRLTEEQRRDADLWAAGAWIQNSPVPVSATAEALLAVHEGVNDTGTYRDTVKKVAAGETEGRGSAVVNPLMKWLSLGRVMSVGENALDTVKEREAHLKKLRRETYLGTKAFEMLAGEQVAGSTVAGEYSEKYRYWQYPELLQEVRRLSRNLSADQIARIIEQSPRKAWPMARQIGYRGNLDDFSKLYMASNYLKSAGRSYGASATFSEMLTTGQPAYEIQQRKQASSGYNPAQGSFYPAMGTYGGPGVRVQELGEALENVGGNSTQVSQLNERSVQEIKKAFKGAADDINDKAVYTAAAALGPHLDKSTSGQMDTMQVIRSDSGTNTNGKISQMISSTAGNQGRVNSADFTYMVNDMKRIVDAFGKTAEGQRAGQQAQQQLMQKAMEAMLKRASSAPPVQQQRNNIMPPSVVQKQGE